MNKDWSKTTLGKIISEGNGKFQTGPFGSQLHASDYVKDGIPYIMPANMKNNRVDIDNIARISEKDAKRLSKHIVKKGDILYSRRGDITLKALITDKEVGYFCGTGCLLIRAGDKIDSEFLTYLLSTETNKVWIVKQAVGATMPNLNTDILASFPLYIPDLKTQQSIAAILSALDKKIALNKQINARLEEMAKTLYDYWFVQFDFPDANGKPYKSSGGEMVFDETLKRKIPKGWEVKSLNQVADIVMGQSPDGASYNLEQEGTIFFQGSTDFDWRFPNVRQYTTSPTRFAQKGDILLSVRAPVGDLNISPFECCIGRGLAALRSKSGNNSFLFYVMKYFKTVFERRNTEGTTFGSITKDDLHSLKLVAPADNVLEKYNEIASKYDEMIFIRSQQNHQLTQLRDFLLPMLMNGQVSVAE